MRKVPQGQQRSAESIGNATHVMRIATGEATETMPDDSGKNAAAVELGKRGGEARAAKLDTNEKWKIFEKAAWTRWR